MIKTEEFTDKITGGTFDMETNANLGDPLKNRKPIGKNNKKGSGINLKPRLKISVESIEERVTRVMKAQWKKRGHNFTHDGTNQAPNNNGPVSSSNLFSEVKMGIRKLFRKKPNPHITSNDTPMHTPSRPALNDLNDEVKPTINFSKIKKQLREGEVVPFKNPNKPSAFTGKADVIHSLAFHKKAYNLGYKHGYEVSGHANPYPEDHKSHSHYNQGYSEGSKGLKSNADVYYSGSYIEKGNKPTKPNKYLKQDAK
jgi:hypothetical protein